MAASVSKPSHTVLVVDDDEEVLALTVDVLEMAGYTVLSTPDPRHALRLARSHAEPLHLLLTDVVMPLMNGLQLAAEFQVLRPEAKIVLMSAYRTQEIDAPPPRGGFGPESSRSGRRGRPGRKDLPEFRSR
jgi:CheY-like chemotaxis protein